MKRLVLLLAALMALLVLVGFMTPSTSERQFDGIAKYTNGSPAPEGTRLRVYLGGSLKDEIVLTGSNGYYEIWGVDTNYPAGTYRLEADDLTHAMGDENVYHSQEGTTTRDITLDTQY